VETGRDAFRSIPVLAARVRLTLTATGDDRTIARAVLL